jgi:hypothetical protein
MHPIFGGILSNPLHQTIADDFAAEFADRLAELAGTAKAYSSAASDRDRESAALTRLAESARSFAATATE